MLFNSQRHEQHYWLASPTVVCWPAGSANYNPGKITKAFSNFEGAEVEGGVLERDTFVDGRPEGRVKCTFYGSGRCLLDLHLCYIYGEYPAGQRLPKNVNVVSFEGAVRFIKDNTSFQCSDANWACSNNCHPYLTRSGNFIITLVNGDQWKGELVDGYETGI